MNTTAPKFDRPNPLVPRLRAAALREAKVDTATQAKASPKFDADHKATPPQNVSVKDFDRDNGVAKYPGQNVEHIGNGSGGVRR